MLSLNISGQEGRSLQIRNELVQLFNEQKKFFEKGGLAKATQAETAGYEQRRERIRALFTELGEMRKVA
jgi:uncharacterized protein YdeI (YjbR/CyaY-like superfamily)